MIEKDVVYISVSDEVMKAIIEEQREGESIYECVNRMAAYYIKEHQL